MTCNHFVVMEGKKAGALISNLQYIFENLQSIKTFLVLFLPLCNDMQSLPAKEENKNGSLILISNPFLKISDQLKLF